MRVVVSGEEEGETQKATLQNAQKKRTKKAGEYNGERAPLS